MLTLKRRSLFLQSLVLCMLVSLSSQLTIYRRTSSNLSPQRLFLLKQKQPISAVKVYLSSQPSQRQGQLRTIHSSYFNTLGRPNGNSIIRHTTGDVAMSGKIDKSSKPRRRSPRLAAHTVENVPEKETIMTKKYGKITPSSTKTRRRTISTKATTTDNVKRSKRISANNKSKEAVASTEANKKEEEIKKYLTRTREKYILKKSQEENNKISTFVMGIDEAGRGPLAGPVVASAVVCPTNIDGIMDSKKITKEDQREELYGKIINSPDMQYAVTIIDSKTIDRINILQASLLAMRICTETLIDNHSIIQEGDTQSGLKSKQIKIEVKGETHEIDYMQHADASASYQGNYVVYGNTGTTTKTKNPSKKADDENYSFFALVDGNHMPKDMPCDCEPIIKGDSKEYSIAVASIIAKVTRDRLMHEYDTMFPMYDLKQNKGYPTSKHMSAVHKHGASLIHRRTFAPLKHMTFDENGNVVVDEDDDDHRDANNEKTTLSGKRKRR